MAVLLNAGDQLPVIPSMDVVGIEGGDAPLQMAGMEAKVGVILGSTVTLTFSSDVLLFPSVMITV